MAADVQTISSVREAHRAGAEQEARPRVPCITTLPTRFVALEEVRDRVQHQALLAALNPPPERSS